MFYLKSFENHSGYAQDESGLTLPNVSYCELEDEVHYNPWVRPNLCYREVGSYYVLCTNDGRLYILSGDNIGRDTYYLGWNGNSTKIFHNMAATGDWGVISGAVATYGVFRGDVTASVATTSVGGGTTYLVNDTITWQGTDYVFSNGTWTPSIPGGEYIEPGGEIIEPGGGGK